MYGEQWLVVRVEDRRVLTSGNVGHCLAWVNRYGATDRAAATGASLSPKCQL
jgi:hypothetical protein